jgi:gas vesicle protein
VGVCSSALKGDPVNGIPANTTAGGQSARGEEHPYYRGVVYCFLTGLGSGLALGILFAPRSGGESRRLIGQKAQQATDRLKATVDQGQEYIERRGTDLRSQANELIDQGKEAVHRKTDQLTRAVAAGTEAYRSRIDDAETGGDRDRDR